MPHKHDEHKDEDECISMSCCYLHPKQVLEGVCPLCLNEKLLVLAANKKGTYPLDQKELEQITNANPSSNTSPYSKIFALGSILNRFELSRHKHDAKSFNHVDRSPSPQDSFISIRFGENGIGSWEKNNPTSRNLSLDHHMKSRSTMRWQKQIGRLFRLAKWKRPDKEVQKEGVVKARNGLLGRRCK